MDRRGGIGRLAVVTLVTSHRHNAKGLAVRVAAAVAALICAEAAIPEEVSHQSVVACLSEGGSPWVLKGYGRLSITKARAEQMSSWAFGSQTYESRTLSNADGSTLTSGPGLLIGRLVELAPARHVQQSPRGPLNSAERSPNPYPRGQRVSVIGEILEYAGPIFLVVAIGSKCPRNL
jgi:hypothetical protein